MKLGDLDIPNKAIVAWRRMLVSTDDTRLSEWASDYKNFVPGFRPGKVPGDAVRNRLITLLEQNGTISEHLRSALERFGLTRSIINVFSEEVISAIAPSLNAYYGDLAFAAMLLDDREVIRRLGYESLCASDDEAFSREINDELREASDSASDIRSAAACRLTSQLGPFIRDFSQIILEAKGSDKPPAEDARSKATGEVRLLREKLSQLESELKRSKSHAEKLQAELLAKEQELLKAKRSRDTSKEQLTLTNEKLAALESALEAEVTNAVNKRLDERIRPWIRPLVVLEQNSESLSKNDLLTEVEDVLKRQLEIDKQYGTMQKLESQVAELRGAREQLVSALTSSMRPRREIPALINRIDLEIENVDRLLGRRERPALSSIATELSREINLSTSLEMLSEIRSRVIKAKDTNALPSTESKSLFDLIHQKTDQFYCAASIERGLSGDIESLAALPKNHFMALMLDRLNCRLIVDGHNLLFRLKDLFHKFYEKDAPKAIARAELAKRLLTMIDEFQSVRVDAWFDGPELTNETLHENLRVHFSGGSGDNRADDSVVSFLRALKPEDLFVTFVVTDDRGLRERCTAVGAKVLACDEVANLLRE